MNEENAEKEPENIYFNEFICYTCDKKLNWYNWKTGHCDQCGTNLIGFLSDKE